MHKRAMVAALVSCGAVLLLTVPLGSSASAATAPPPQPAVGHGDPSLAHSPQMLQMLARGGRGAGPGAANAQGIDIASFQHPNGAGIDWGQVAGAGYKYAYIKATEGNYYQNPYFSGDNTGSAGASIFHGAYHFAIPNASDGASQANYALDSTGYTNDGHTLPPMLDMEWDPYSGNACYGLDASHMVGWIGAFSNQVQQRTGRLPVIYTASAWWNQCTGGSSAFNANPLNIASWGASPQTPGWSNWTFWQSTDSASVPGISGSVDGGSFNGDVNQLGTFAKGASAQQAAAPQPAAPPQPSATPPSPPAPAVGLYRAATQIGTYPTLQAAVDAAQSGDTIKAPAGTYNEVVTINRTIALTFAGAQAGTPAKSHSGDESTVTGFATSGAATPAITVDGFTVTPGTSNNGDGIHAPTAGTSLTVQNSVISGYQGHGSQSASSNRAVFQNNVFKDALAGNDPVGIQVSEKSSDVMIENNVFSTASRGAGGADVNLTKGPFSSPVVRGNVMSGGVTAVAMTNASGGQIASNQISGQDQQPAIWLRGADQSTSVSGNSITGKGAGVVLDRSDPTLAANTGTTLTSNVLVKNATAIAIGSSAIASTETVQAHGNTITGSTTNGISNGSPGFVDATRNWWGSIFGPSGTNSATGNVTVSPRCADAGCTTSAQSSVRVTTASNQPTVDLSSLLAANQVTLPANEDLNIVDAAGQLLIQGGTTVAGQGQWDGVLIAPTPAATTASIPAPSGRTAHARSVVEAGSRGTDLRLSASARLLVPGAAGQGAAWVDTSGGFHQITAQCSADSSAANATLAEGTDCVIPVGSDEVIWTRHLSRFVTYTLDPATSTTSATSTSTTGASTTGASTTGASTTGASTTGASTTTTAASASDPPTDPPAASSTPFTSGPGVPALPFLPTLALGALATAIGAVLAARKRRS